MYGLDTRVREVGPEIEALIRAMVRAQEAIDSMSDSELTELLAGMRPSASRTRPRWRPRCLLPGTV